jgi:ketosteroid isomerase-like protein
MKTAAFGAMMVAALPLFAQPGDRQGDLERIVAAERAFAARAQVVNARQAFVEFFAPNAILFAPFSAPAFPRLRESPDWDVNIKWRPTAAGVSGAGDMGYTTGPAEYRRTPEGAPVGFGHYTSVWQRQPDGRYLVCIDVGIDHPAPPVRIADWSTPAARPPLAPVLDASAQRGAAHALRELDTRTGASAQAGAAAAFATVLADDARLHRGGRLPVVGRSEALAALTGDQAFGWAPEGVVVAQSGDFGYAYGRGRSAGADPTELVYLNIWQQRDGGWRLIVHVSHEVRPRPPQ